VGVEIEFVNAAEREWRLRDALEQVRDNFDYILLDCPPSLGLLTLNALSAADSLLIPLQCEYYSKV
jgi:chromosome partitioning protein